VRSAREQASYEKRKKSSFHGWKLKMLADRGLEMGREISDRMVGTSVYVPTYKYILFVLGYCSPIL
jgi:hypothetical protein